MPLEVRLTFATGGPAPLTLRLEQTQRNQQWTRSLPAGAVVTGVEVDPNLWNLLEVTSLIRNLALQPTTPTSLAADVTAPLSVYPNPCTDRLSVEPSEASRFADVLDLTGRVVAHQRIAARAMNLDTRALAAGSYVLRLTTSEGAARQVSFVKK